MSSSKNLQFSRRTLMRAAGSTLLLPTFLKNAFAQTAVTRPNLVLMMQTNGTHQASYWPTGTAWTSDILKGLLTDPVVGPKVTLIKNINLNKQGSPSGNGHDWGWHGLYSGFDNVGLNNGGPSLDQILISKLQFTNRFKNIHCGVIAENHSLINPGRASFSYATPTLQVPCETDIYALYTKVFGAVPATPARAAEVGARCRGVRSHDPGGSPRGQRADEGGLSPHGGSGLRESADRHPDHGRRGPGFTTSQLFDHEAVHGRGAADHPGERGQREHPDAPVHGVHRERARVQHGGRPDLPVWPRRWSLPLPVAESPRNAGRLPRHGCSQGQRVGCGVGQPDGRRGAVLRAPPDRAGPEAGLVPAGRRKDRPRQFAGRVGQRARHGPARHQRVSDRLRGRRRREAEAHGVHGRLGHADSSAPGNHHLEHHGRSGRRLWVGPDFRPLRRIGSGCIAARTAG